MDIFLISEMDENSNYETARKWDAFPRYPAVERGGYRYRAVGPKIEHMTQEFNVIEDSYKDEKGQIIKTKETVQKTKENKGRVEPVFKKIECFFR